MIMNFFRMLKDRQKDVGIIGAPADGTLAAHCRPNGNSAFPLRGQLWTRYVTRRGGEKNKKEMGQDVAIA